MGYSRRIRESGRNYYDDWHLRFNAINLVGLPFCGGFCLSEYLDESRERQKLGSQFLPRSNLYGCIRALCHPTVLATAVLFVTHVIVDPLKARYKIIGPIWLDQLLHLLTIVLILGLHI